MTLDTGPIARPIVPGFNQGRNQGHPVAGHPIAGQRGAGGRPQAPAPMRMPVPPAAQGGPLRRPRWQRQYARLVLTSDLLALITTAASYLLWGTGGVGDIARFGAPILALVIICLACTRTWDSTVLGQGSAEFTRLLNGLAAAAVVVALVSLALQLPSGRPWVFGFFPIAAVLAASGRVVLRMILHHYRRNDRAMLSVLAVGSHEAVQAMIARTRRAPHHGLRVIAACTPTGRGAHSGATIDGVPVVGDLDNVASCVLKRGVNTVSVAQAPGWSPARMQQLAWDLEGTSTNIVVDPGLMEIAGPRLHMSSVDGMPLLRLTQPRFTGIPWLLKSIVDRTASFLLLLMLAPLMIAVAIAVKLDGGPVFFRQTRIGLDGRSFRMVKFRSMVVDAEARLADLIAADEGAGLLFKVRHDPRITRVGSWLRKYSLDELPQLFNVLGGSMSMIGPRPPLPREVAGYARDARRRLLVKPGMTGLWQVSGRSDLSWEESVRLDLRYVENWSLALDAQILLKTIGAVARGDGAY